MKKFLLILIGLFIIIQLVPYSVPANIEDKAGEALEAPDNVQAILKTSCYDCHSNHTSYPWYSSIAPASWFTKMHVKKGRSKMNFSIWNSYSDEKKTKYLDKIPKAIESAKMPLPSYLLIHKDAILNDADKKTINGWTSEAKFDLE